MVQAPKRIRLGHETHANQEAIFHIVFHAAHGEEPFEDFATGDAVWTLLTNELSRGSIQILAACLMPDHLHALVSPRSRDIIKWVDGFKSYSTRVAQQFRTQRILWQPGFYDHVIRNRSDFDSVVAYIIRNPSVGELVRDDEEWPWVGSWLTE